ncbi:dihydropteroate synthase [soil metagenome]
MINGSARYWWRTRDGETEPRSTTSTGAPRTGRLHVVGILNVTPDSFSDGGRWDHVDAAVQRGFALHAVGADYVDVGGESTRPGAGRVPEHEELRRVEPVVRQLSDAGIRVSIDTTRSRVAEAALTAGAVAVNDISGGIADPRMARVVADAGSGWIVVHGRGVSSTMNDLAHYDDVVTEVIAELIQRVEAALAAGVAVEALVADPGLGFAKHGEHNLRLLDQLDRICDEVALPILVGASRKSFLGGVLADARGVPRPVGLREDATTAITAFAALSRAWGVRVHNVRASVDAARTLNAITAAPRAAQPAPRSSRSVRVPSQGG